MGKGITRHIRLFALCLSTAICWPSSPSHAAVDRDKMLSDPGVFATFAVFQVDSGWWRVPKGGRLAAAKETKAILAKHADKVIVDAYLLRGLTDGADLLLRLHGKELADNQRLLMDLMASTWGRSLVTVHTWNGFTRKPNYVPGMPEAIKNALKSATEPGPKTYAIVIPIAKDTAWWQSAKETRGALMKEHTEAALPFVRAVSRKLYHASGLSNVDFVTYFETNRLDELQSLVLALGRAKESTHNRAWGPLLLGTIHPVDDVLAALLVGR